MLKLKTASANEEPWPHGLPWFDAGHRLAETEHLAPRRLVGVDGAEAKEAQSGFGKDDAAEADGCLDDEGTKDVGNNVTEHDARIGRADRST